MLNYIKGNLLAVSNGIIAHGCNAQGVMGSGVAKAVRAKNSEAWLAYRANYEEVGLIVGQVIFVPVRTGLVVANAITQEYFGPAGCQWVDYDAVEECFTKIGAYSRLHDLPIYLPRIGAGLGGGDWAELEIRINLALHGIPATVVDLA